MRRRFSTPIIAGALVALLGASALAATTSTEVKLTDEKADAQVGALDIVGVRFGRSPDGRLRGIVTMADAWETSALKAPDAGGTPGSVCLRLYTKADPASNVSDYLACATVAADGTTLRGELLTEKAGDLPQPAKGTVSVSRPTERSITLRFAQSAIAKPASVAFVAEATRPGCVRISCVDRAPEAPKAGTLKLAATKKSPATGR